MKCVLALKRDIIDYRTLTACGAGCEDCSGCPYFGGKCTRSKKAQIMQVSKVLLEKREIALKNILSKEGIRYRMNRSIQVEGAFGVLKHDYGFTRFLTCGKINV